MSAAEEGRREREVASSSIPVFAFDVRLGTAAKDPNEMDDEDELDIEKEEQFEIGNRNRALWKKIGRSVASNVRWIFRPALTSSRLGSFASVAPNGLRADLALPPSANALPRRPNSPSTSELSTELSQVTSPPFSLSAGAGRITSGLISTLGLRLGLFSTLVSLPLSLFARVFLLILFRRR